MNRIPRRTRPLVYVSLAAAVFFCGLLIVTLWHGLGYQGSWIRIFIKSGYINFAQGHIPLPSTWYHQPVVPTFLTTSVWPQWSSNFSGRSWSLSIPILYLILASVGFAILFSRRRRKRGGGCISCGYDLTGNTSGVCPECGSPIADDHRLPHR